MKTVTTCVSLLLVFVAAAPSFAQRRTERQRIDEMILLNDVELGSIAQATSEPAIQVQGVRKGFQRPSPRREMNFLGKLFQRVHIRWSQLVTPRIIIEDEDDEIPLGL